MMLLAAMLAAPVMAADLPLVDEKCQEVAQGGPPADYSEQAQADFLLNYTSLYITSSPLHGVVPAQPGHGYVGVQLNGVPPLGCAHRLVLGYTKTEDTNKTPVVPKLTVLYTLPKVAGFVPYASLTYLPPIPLLGTRNVIVGGEVGAGKTLDSGLQIGARYHHTMQKTVGEIAEPFVVGDPVYLDLYVGSTFGFDLMAGWHSEKVSPYLAVGYLDVTTFFLIGDDDYVGNNYSPYAGPEAAVGVQGHLKQHIGWDLEFYTAPKNFNTADLAALDGESAPGSAPARIFTGRARIAYTF